MQFALAFFDVSLLNYLNLLFKAFSTRINTKTTIVTINPKPIATEIPCEGLNKTPIKEEVINNNPNLTNSFPEYFWAKSQDERWLDDDDEEIYG